MNEEQLIEFVNWLPTAVPEFQNATPDQIVQSLNQMAESEEGQQMISQLFTAFQESKQAGNSQMFKKGGKMAAFVNKYGNGGCVSCKKKEILRGGMVNKIAEKMEDGGKNRLNKLLPKKLAIVNATPVNQNGGELATMTSAETANNIGLIPMAQDGLSLEPEVKPGGLRGLFWRPTFVPRVDASGTEMDTDWIGERATYYKPNGSLVQILTKQYAPGNTAKTTRTIRYPFTPMADTTTIVRTSSDDDKRKVDNSKFNGVFDLNFNKRNK